MKYVLTLTAVAIYTIATSGCVSVHRDDPTPVTTRTTTIDTPVTPAVTSTTTTY